MTKPTRQQVFARNLQAWINTHYGTIRQASELTGLDEDYLSRLCRQGVTRLASKTATKLSKLLVSEDVQRFFDADFLEVNNLSRAAQDANARAIRERRNNLRSSNLIQVSKQQLDDLQDCVGRSEVIELLQQIDEVWQAMGKSVNN